MKPRARFYPNKQRNGAWIVKGYTPWQFEHCVPAQTRAAIVAAQAVVYQMNKRLNG